MGASDPLSCVANTIEIVSAIVEAAAATAAATKSALKFTAGKQAKEHVRRIVKSTFKAHLRQVRKKIIKDAIKDNMKGKIESKSHELMVEWATQDADTLAEAYEEQAKKADEDPALTFVKDVDPSGLAVAIDGSHGKTVSANKQAANWMSVFSIFDPVGIMGAIGSIIKHDHC